MGIFLHETLEQYHAQIETIIMIDVMWTSKQNNVLIPYTKQNQNID